MSSPRIASSVPAAVALAAAAAMTLTSVAVIQAADNKLVYADFEVPMDQRPVSKRGGLVQLTSFQEDVQHPAKARGMDGVDPPAPAVKMTSKDGSNHAAVFEYELVVPNQWAGAGVEIHGLPDQDGKPQSDDVSEFKNLVLQLYTADVTNIRVEMVSRGLGMDQQAYPQFTFRTKAGFNTYKVPLKEVAQPQWLETKIDVKKILERLTAVTISTYCDNCRPEKGTIVVDNLVFEK
jgi:hypothetical protein